MPTRRAPPSAVRPAAPASMAASFAKPAERIWRRRKAALPVKLCCFTGRAAFLRRQIRSAGFAKLAAMDAGAAGRTADGGARLVGIRFLHGPLRLPLVGCLGARLPRF